MNMLLSCIASKSVDCFRGMVFERIKERQLQLAAGYCHVLMKWLPQHIFGSAKSFREKWILFKFEVNWIHPLLVVPSWMTQIVLLPIIAFERYLLVCHPTRVNTIHPTRYRMFLYFIATSTIIAVNMGYERRYSRVIHDRHAEHSGKKLSKATYKKEKQF